MRENKRSRTYSRETPCGTMYITVVALEIPRVILLMGKPMGCADAQLAGIEWGINMAIQSGVSIHDIVQGLSGISCNMEFDDKISCCATVSGILGEAFKEKHEKV